MLSGPASPARVGVALDLILTATLTIFLLVATGPDRLDPVPRPLVLAALLATPAVIGAMAIARRRRSLLIAAAMPLVPASLLSWAFVTLPFAIVAVLFVAGAASLPRPAETAGARLIHASQGFAVASLVLLAGWAVLFGLTTETCVSDAVSTLCGNGVITVEGLGVAVALLVGAVVLAAASRGADRASQAPTIPACPSRGPRHRPTDFAGSSGGLSIAGRSWPSRRSRARPSSPRATRRRPPSCLRRRPARPASHPRPAPAFRRQIGSSWAGPS